jgi:hypothetical protein
VSPPLTKDQNRYGLTRASSVHRRLSDIGDGSLCPNIEHAGTDQWSAAATKGKALKAKGFSCGLCPMYNSCNTAEANEEIEAKKAAGAAQAV